MGRPLKAVSLAVFLLLLAGGCEDPVQNVLEKRLYEAVVRHYPFEAIHKLLADFAEKCFMDGLQWGVIIGAAVTSLIFALMRRK